MKRLTNLEQQICVDVIEESVHANVLNDVQNQLPKLLPKAVSYALKMTSVNLSHPTPKPSINPLEYELKDQLYEKMFQTAAYLKHPKIMLYMMLYKNQCRLMNLMHDTNQPSYLITKELMMIKILHEGEKRNDDDELRQDDDQVHEVQTEEIPEESEEHEYKDGFVTLFGKLVKKIFKKDKITKEDIDGLSFKLLKGTCKNCFKLEYNMDQCSLALTDRIDKINLKSDRFQDLSKPLPLTGPLGIRRIPVNYFFNHELEYLVKRSKERTYALFVTKIKAARYEDERIEEMIPFYGALVFRNITKMLNLEFVTGILVISCSTKEKIIVSRTDEKEYMFCEADFPYLNKNDIEDLYLLKI
ncbi:hypothetical protein Tco_0946747 [Tanacetum coccineum]